MSDGLSRTSSGQQVYEPDGAVLRAFLLDRSHVSIIRGPLGSGTSSACCMRIYSHALEQRPNDAGRRVSRWCVVRDSYPNLRNTTIRTWLDWFPQEKYGRFFWDRPARHVISIGDVDLEVIFMSLDAEEDVAKCRSIDFTGFWFNELEYMRFLLFMEAESRTGRFPAKKDGGSNWDGVIADMNAPDETHWVPKLMGEIPVEEGDDEIVENEVIKAGKPFNWEYFVQPPAVLEVRDATGRNVVGYKTNPEAENVKWLKDGYYEEKSRGKTKAWIDSRLRNKITFVIDGTPVFKSFNQDTHIAPLALEVVPEHDVVVGLDFGRNRPAAVCGQEINGRIYIQHEFRRYGLSSVGFAPAFKQFLERTYAGCRIKFWGDPKGADRAQADDETSYRVFEFNGMIVHPAPVKANAWRTRIEAVEFCLNDGTGGVPRFQLSPSGCPTLKAAMCGRYQIKKNAKGDPEPDKDKFSDVADALQYLLLGLGYGRTMIGLSSAQENRTMSTAPRGESFRLGARKVS